MISSGALPKVAFSRPPIASPVRVPSCSVERTISRAIGRLARAAEKNRSGAGTCAYSSAIDTGTNAKSQLIEGFSEIRESDRGWSSVWVIESVHDREEEARGPPAHEDARQGLDAAVQPPGLRQHHVAV